MIVNNKRNWLDLFEACELCPRNCGVNRLAIGADARKGFCGENSDLRVAYVGPHFGEEPPITGTHGSGTVFFSGCSLRCSFCQNFQISNQSMGESLDLNELFERIREMIDRHQVHNVNFVTPDHFWPYAFTLMNRLRDRGYELPLVYNLSGYQSTQWLKIAEDYADIYLPDFKYADATLSTRLSKAKDYPSVALDAISEMVRQKGFLDAAQDETSLAKQGVLVRHLILPGHIENSISALSMLYLEFGNTLPLSLMSQYQPVLLQKDKDLNRTLSLDEFRKVFNHATDLGFQNLYVQFPEEQALDTEHSSPFLPDFSQTQPFS